MTSGLAPISICRQNKPQALLTALMHARESDSRHTFTSMPGSLRERAQARPAGLTVLLYFLGHLLEKYSRGDPDAAWQMQVIACSVGGRLAGRITYANSASSTKSGSLAFLS